MAEKSKKQSQPTDTTENAKKDFRKVVATLGIATRGRVFQGKVIRKFPKRVTIEFERTVKIQKYERFMSKRTRIHARLPDEFASDINLGDLIKVQECRPLSKLIHSVVIEKVRNADEKIEIKSPEEKK